MMRSVEGTQRIACWRTRPIMSRATPQLIPQPLAQLGFQPRLVLRGHPFAAPDDVAGLIDEDEAGKLLDVELGQHRAIVAGAEEDLVVDSLPLAHEVDLLDLLGER